MKLLAIETATTGCSVALRIGDETLSRYEPVARRQTETVLPMVEAVLAEASERLTALDMLAFSRGPGAFTGVRVGTSVAQGLAMSADLPVVPVSTLAACAWMGIESLGADGAMLAGFDARMGEIYLAGYQRQGDRLICLLEDTLCSPDALPDLSGRRWQGVGSAGIYEQQVRVAADLSGPWLTDVEPHARAVAALALKGHPVPAERALPVYLRNRVTQG